MFLECSENQISSTDLANAILLGLFVNILKLGPAEKAKERREGKEGFKQRRPSNSVQERESLPSSKVTEHGGQLKADINRVFFRTAKAKF